LGYPTANIRVSDENKLIPGFGIYAVHVMIKHPDEKSIIKFMGMMSIGIRPTIGGKKKSIEVNIFDFDKEIYGQIIRVYVIKYLREEKKFDGLQELIKAIDQDKINSLKILSE
jgi:riboflavin kinase/FMN adenylyltransferase